METLFTLVFGLAIAMFIFVFVRSFFRIGRISDKVFRHVERELDRQQAEPARCDHCGSRVTSAAACPNCGAPMK